MQPNSPIAIVGMACRLPGARDLDEYWRLLIEGRSSIGPMPEDRLDRRLHLDPEGRDRAGGPRMGTTYTDLAGVVPPVKSGGDGLLPEELAAACDPTHVTFCDVAAEAVRSAGWDPRRMPTRRGGVYVGHTRGTVVAGQLIYGSLVGRAAPWLRDCPSIAEGPLEADGLIDDVVASVRSQMPARAADGSPHLDAHCVASLASGAFGFEGPAMAVNAACASSLIAMSMGVNALDQGSVDCVVVGGASHCKLDSLVLFSKAQSASATGSRPFDDAADGLVAAEGYVALVLKRLDRALADGDPVWAVVRGVGVSSDGKGKSLWAPRREGQVEAIHRAYPEGLGPESVDYLEAHATSTQVGDATELAALDEVFAPARSGKNKLPIGSAKGNVGHTLETAGMAGLVKAVLAMRAGVVPPAVNLEKLNTKVDWDALSLEVAREPTPWPDAGDGRPRCAAVNAFGIGGLNAHVVLQDRVAPELAAAPSVPAARAAAPPAATEDRRIAVIGASVLAPGALSLAEFGELLHRGESQLAPVFPERWDAEGAIDPERRRAHHTVSGVGAQLRGWEYDWKRHRVPPKQVKAADPLQFMLLDTVDAALRDAGLHDAGRPSDRWDRRSAAVMIGSDFLGDFSADLQLAVRLPHLLDTIRRVLETRGASHSTIDGVLAEFAERFAERNPALLDETGSFTTSTLASRISKTYDLMGGAAALDAGDASAAALLNAGTEWLLQRRCDTLICASGQRAMGLFNYERLSLLGRLKGDDGRGFLHPGEGAGVLVLKRLADAQADGDPIRAVLDGATVDRAPEPRESTRVTRTVGHWGGAAGMAELLGAIVDEANPDTTLRIHGGGDQRYTVRVTRPGEEKPNADAKPAALPAKATAPSAAGAGQPTLVAVCLSAPDRGGLVDACRGWAERLGADGGAWRELASTRFTPEHPDRLTFVAASPEDAAKKLTLASRLAGDQANATLLAAQGVLLHTAKPTRPRVAWCFAGQGSQYAGMLKGLVEGDADARETLSRIDQTLADRGLARWSTIAWEDTTRLGDDVLQTKLAVLGANWLLADRLTRRGLLPTVVGGHSFGEYAALAQAGVWGWDDAVRATVARAHAVVEGCDDGAMMCTNADAATTDRLCREVRDETGHHVYLANHNSPQQCAVGGDRLGVAELSKRLEAAGLRVIPIPVPRPYHTPLMDRTRAPLEAELQRLLIRPARLPVLSSVSNRYEADPELIRTNLVEQMVTPVRYVDLVKRLDADGADLVVEVGPGRVLTKLHGAILGKASGPLAVATDDRQEGPEASLLLVEAAYELIAPLPADATTAKPRSAQPAAEQPTNPAANGRPANPSQRGVFTASAAAEEERLTIVDLHGSPREMGRQHGRLHREAIRQAAEQIADAVGSRELPPLGPLADDPQSLFGPDDLQELTGFAEGAGVSLSTVVACNLYAYPDLSGLGGCSQLVTPDPASNGLVHAANEDLPVSLTVPALRRRVVQRRRPDEGHAHVTFSAAGQLGGIAGMNAAGVSLSSAMLLDRPRPDAGAAGLLHGAMVRRALQEAATKEQALALFEDPGAGPRGGGGWAVVLTDPHAPEAILLEYDGEAFEARRGDRLLAANHAQLLPPRVPAPRHSVHRHERLSSLYSEPGKTDPVEQAKAALRDCHDGRVGRVTKHRTMNTLCRLDNQLSVVMRPAAGELWVHAPEGEGDDGFVRLQVDGAQQAAPSPTASSPTASSQTVPASAVSHTPAIAQVEAPKQLTAAGYAQAVENHRPPSDRVCDRFVVRMIESRTDPSPAAEAVPLPERGVVVGGEELAAALCEQTGVSWRRSSLERLPEEVHQSLAAGPAGVVIDPQVATNADALAEWFTAIQRVVAEADEAGLTGRLSLVFVSRLGGGFAWSGPADRPAADCLAGLAKAIAMEYRLGGLPTPRVAALDAAPTASGSSLTRAIQKLLQLPANGSVEWALADDKNGLLTETRIVPAPIPGPADNGPGGDAPNAEGCWVVTGGGRGVTALAAERLASEQRCVVHLIGSTEVAIEPAWLDLDEPGLERLKKQTLAEAVRAGVRPPLSAWTRVERMLEVARNLQRMRASGLEVHYHACDLRDPAAVAACVDGVRRRGVPIVGVIHGAGFERSCRFGRKKEDDVRRTLAVKLSGLDALESALEGDPLRWFVCFGSTAGRFGSVGQTDYALANDAMARRMARLRARRPACRCVCLHWTAWGDVGMAMRQEVLTSLRERGIALMPAAEGIDHLMAEINSDATDTEVVITDASRFKQLVAGDPLLKHDGDATASPTGVTRRYALRMQERPNAGAGPAPSAPRRALVWGDAAWGHALVEGLRRAGADCLLISPEDPADRSAEAIRRLAEAGPIDRVLIAPPTGSGDPTGAIVGLIECLQAWARSAGENGFGSGGPRVATVTRLGGDHGRGGRFASAAAFAGMAGLIKSLTVELHERGAAAPSCVAIDVADSPPTETVVDRVLQEVNHGRGGDLEVAIAPNAGADHRLVYIETPLPSRPAHEVAAPSGDWLVTGGGRGVTCEAAIEIARRYGLRLHVVGSSDLSLVPGDWLSLGEAERAQLKKQVIAEALKSGRKEPPMRAWERLERAGEVAANLERYRAAGVETFYYRCDLSDPAAVASVVGQARQAARGEITGLMHGAGYEKSADLLKKKRADIERTLRVKVDALDALLDALAIADLRHVVAFGSISGRLGGLGQIDYCLANDALAKRLLRLGAEAPHLRATTIDWHSWDGVGMAVRPETRQIKEKLGMTHMSVAEGVARLLDELEHGLPEGEVLITTPEHLQRMGQRAEPGEPASLDSLSKPKAPRLVLPTSNGLAVASEEKRYTLRFDPERDPFLTQHRFKDRPLLPLVIGIEAILQAGATAAGDAPGAAAPGGWRLDNLAVDGPMRFMSEQPQEAEVCLSPRGEGAWGAELTSRFRNAKGQLSPKPRRHFSAELKPAAVADDSQSVPPPSAAELAGLRDVAIRDDLVLYHGPIFRQVKQIHVDGQQAIASIQTPPIAELAGAGRHAEGWVTSPAVLDACLFACGVQLYVTDRGAVSVPLGIDRLTVLAPCEDGERLWLRLTNRSAATDADEAYFDFVLFDDQGRPRLAAEGYRATIVARSAPTEAAANGRAEAL